MIPNCPPRFGTARNHERATRGPDVEAVGMMLGRHAFMPWQRHVVDVANELDPDTGMLYYETVVLIVPRQQGKTTLLEPTLFAAARRRRDIDVIYTAQDRQMSKRRLIDELADKRLARRPELAGKYTVRRSNGSEAITLYNGSRISTAANTDAAGHGLTLDLAVIDEAFAHDDLTVVTALEPTTITRPDPQVWIVSTVGDGTDGLLLHYQDIGMASLTDPDTRVAFFEWSAPDDADRHDPATWWATMPALGHTITERRIASRFATLDPAVIDRAYLCRRPTVDLTAKLPPADWMACYDPSVMPAAPYTIAVTVNAARTHTSVAVCGAGTEPGTVAVAVDRRPGVSWAPAALGELATRHRPSVILADRRGGAGSIIDAGPRFGATITELTAADVVTYCGDLYDMVTDHTFRHAGQTELDDAAEQAVTRPLGDAWAWDSRRSPVDVSALVATTNAAGAWRVNHAGGSRPRAR